MTFRYFLTRKCRFLRGFKIRMLDSVIIRQKRRLKYKIWNWNFIVKFHHFKKTKSNLSHILNLVLEGQDCVISPCNSAVHKRKGHRGAYAIYISADLLPFCLDADFHCRFQRWFFQKGLVDLMCLVFFLHAFTYAIFLTWTICVNL